MKEQEILKAFSDLSCENKMLKSIEETINFLACIAYKHEEISRGRFVELTGKVPEKLMYLYFEGDL